MQEATGKDKHRLTPQPPSLMGREKGEICSGFSIVRIYAVGIAFQKGPLRGGNIWHLAFAFHPKLFPPGNSVPSVSLCSSLSVPSFITGGNPHPLISSCHVTILMSFGKSR